MLVTLQFTDFSVSANAVAPRDPTELSEEANRCGLSARSC